MKLFKFDLKCKGETSIRMPNIFNILSVQDKRNKPVVMVACDTAEGYHERIFFTLESGDEISSGSKYVGTVNLDGGEYIRHYFYR